MRTVTYTTAEEKIGLIEEAESQGETQLHDNHFFDDDGVFDHGELVFDTIIDPPPTAEEIAAEEKRVELQVLGGRIRDKSATLPDVVEYLTLRDGL